MRAPPARQPLVVRSARVTYAGPDRLDVTRKSGAEGLFLAPSWELLRPFLEARREILAPGALLEQETPEGGRRTISVEEALAALWSGYVRGYRAEMYAAYLADRGPWDALLARETVTLVCYCADARRCHRAILRARILPKLGAVDGGELAEAHRDPKPENAKAVRTPCSWCSTHEREPCAICHGKGIPFDEPQGSLFGGTP